MMRARFVSAVVLLAVGASAAMACTYEKAPPASAPPAPATAAPAPTPTGPMVTSVPCPPVGVWKGAGHEIKVTAADKPGTYDVWTKGPMSGQGTGQMSGQQFKVDTGAATGGAYSCTMNADCQTMNCGFAGQPPTTFNKQ